MRRPPFSGGAENACDPTGTWNVAVAPGKGGLATFVPRLDEAGSGIKAQRVTTYVADKLDYNLFSPRSAGLKQRRATRGAMRRSGLHRRKVAGGAASLEDPALDRLPDFAAGVGLVGLIHNDIDTPFAKPGGKPAYLEQMTALLKRHGNAAIIWAHRGVGRVVRRVSWDEIANHIVAGPETTKITAAMMERYPDRFPFGADEVAHKTESAYTRASEYKPLRNALFPETSEEVRKANYKRIFNAARRMFRDSERVHANSLRCQLRKRSRAPLLCLLYAESHTLDALRCCRKEQAVTSDPVTARYQWRPGRRDGETHLINPNLSRLN